MLYLFCTIIGAVVGSVIGYSYGHPLMGIGIGTVSGLLLPIGGWAVIEFLVDIFD